MGKSYKANNQSALGRQSMSGVLVLFTDVSSKCMNHYSFSLFSFYQLEFHIVSMCVSQLSSLYLWLRCTFRSYRLAACCPKIPLELSQMACRTPTCLWSGIAARPVLACRAHKSGDLAHHSFPGQRSNFWRSSQCSWTSCTQNKLGAFFVFVSLKKSGKL